MRESGLKSILYGAAVSLLRREGSLKRFMGALKKFSRTLRCIVQKLLHLVFQFQSIQANAVHYLGHSINNISINYFIRKELLLAVTYYYWFLTIAFCDDRSFISQINFESFKVFLLLSAKRETRNTVTCNITNITAITTTVIIFIIY